MITRHGLQFFAQFEPMWSHFNELYATLPDECKDIDDLDLFFRLTAFHILNAFGEPPIPPRT